MCHVHDRRAYYHAKEATHSDSKATSVAHYQRRSCCWEKVSERGIALTWLEGRWLPPHSMHPTKPPNCIYVEKTPELCCLGYCTHKRFREVSNGTSTQVVDWAINKWRAKIAWRELYNARDPPKGSEGGGGRNL